MKDSGPHRLSKTDFISYKECSKNVWVKWHRPDIYDSSPLSEFERALAEMGNEVEEVARNMFKDSESRTIGKRSQGAQELTRQLIAEKIPVIFQPVFSTDTYLAAADVLKWNSEASAYDIYEIKMSSTEEADDKGKVRVDRKKELQFEYDLAFQANVIEECGLKLNKRYLIRLNRNYVRHGDLDYTPGKLFVVEDKTEKIISFQPIVMAEMKGAYLYLSDEKEPVGSCDCYYRGRSSHCTTFAFNNRTFGVPEYSVHDLNRIGSSPKLLKELLDEGMISMDDLNEFDDRLQPKPAKAGAKQPKPRKLNQIKVHRSQKPIIEFDSIRAELDALQFPLYFLDYETSPQAIPPFSGYRPYQHIVFQYSLHVVHEKGAEPEHYECIILDGDPSERICQSLKKHIGPIGSVISWNKTFENSRNKELGAILPEYKKFFDNLIARTYDLKDIVEYQYYVHPKFYGRSSIKVVLAALFDKDDISYKTLGVQNGTDAIEAYRQITTGELSGNAAEQKKKEMLEYCKLDTFAMYRLWKLFAELVE